MADTTVAAGLTVQQWDDKFHTEYVQENRFANFYGTSENSVIQVKEDLQTRKGDSIHFALVNRLTGAGVSGSSTLEGNEEAMDSRSHALTVNQYRNAVRVGTVDEQFSSISLRNAAKTVLKTWAMEDTRDKIITALGSINGVAYASANATQRDAWLVDNADRFLAGAAIGNNASNDHSAALAEVDGTNDKLTAARLSLMKRIALSADPKVSPITVKGGRRYYVVFAGPQAFRDLKDDSVIINAQRDVSLRNQNNKLFKGGDIEWDGMIVHEIDDIASVAEGTSSALIAPVYLCGAQALGIGWAKRWQSKEETFDYGDKHGCAIAGMFGIDKLTFGSGSADTDDLKDHGVVTGWFSAAADA